MSSISGPQRLQQLQQLADDHLEEVVLLTESICRVPAPTFEERERALFVAEEFRRRGYEPEIDEIHNVIVRRVGSGRSKTMLFAAHTDTVFPAGTPLEVVRTADHLMGPGIGDNCVAVASLIALADLLNRENIETPGDLLLVANVGEEGLGNLCGIRALVDRFENELGAVVALEGHALGKITVGAVGSTRLRVTISGPGGHSWGKFGQPSAIHVLGQMIDQVSRLPVSEDPKTTFNIGRVEGGVSVNTIAPHAEMLIDLRSVDPEHLNDLEQRVRQVIEGFEGDNIKVVTEVIGQRPAGNTPRDSALVQDAAVVLQELGIDPQYTTSSTDANIGMARGLPTICIGITRGQDAHCIEEQIEIRPIATGICQLLRLIEQHTP